MPHHLGYPDYPDDTDPEQVRQRLLDALARPSALTFRDRLRLEMLYGLDGEPPQGVAAVAKALGVTPAWIERRRKAALDTLGLPLLPLPDPAPVPAAAQVSASGGLAGRYVVEAGGCVFAMTSREWAAELLGEVAAATAAGAWPEGTSLFDLGRALRRAAANSDQDGTADQRLGELVRGWHAGAPGGAPE